jgi:assimilatory nitrate reductase catalytic subunit
MSLTVTDGKVNVAGDDAFPVNKGALCIKGWTAAALLDHPERLLQPQVRNARGKLQPATWDAALLRVAMAMHETQIKHGNNAVGVFGSGALTNEKAYLLGKFARVALRTANIDYNGRFCMSSAAAAGNKALGIDRGLPFPLADIPHAQVILLGGSNVAETMPPVMQYFESQRRLGGKLIVIDPRASLTAQAATLHLQPVPGTDSALANGLLHLLVRDGMIAEEFIRQSTEGFAEARGTAACYWPERVEHITGVPQSQLLQAARLLGEAKSAMVLTGRGPEQQSQGVNNVLAFINIALALGLPAKAYSGYGCITGQGNGQGGREHGQKADQLPGYRRIDDQVARTHLANIWNISEKDIPSPGMSAYELLDSISQPGGVHALLVVGSNVAISSPRASHINRRLQSLDFLAVVDSFLSETAQLADVVLPVAQWAEEEGTMTNLEGRVTLRRRALAPPEGVLTDIEIICRLAKLLGCRDHFIFENAEDVFAELRRASAGGVADYSGITYEKIETQRGVFWPCTSIEHQGTPRIFGPGSFPKPNGRARFHAVRHQPPAEEPTPYYPLFLTTGRLTGQYNSGTQTRRVGELAHLNGEPKAEVHPATARRYGIGESDKVWLETRRDAARFKVTITANIREDTVFVPFHWGGAQSANRLTSDALDPTSRMPEFKICAVRMTKVIEE